jgi:hypothetical protein
MRESYCSPTPALRVVLIAPYNIPVTSLGGMRSVVVEAECSLVDEISPMEEESISPLILYVSFHT